MALGGGKDSNEKSLSFHSKQNFFLKDCIFAAADVFQSLSQVLLPHK